MEQKDFVNVYSAKEQSTSLAFAKLMKNVYFWMTLALAATGLTAAYVASDLSLMGKIMGNGAIFWGLIIAELVIVMVLSARVMKMSFATAGIMFALYSVLNGVTLSFIFLTYTATSIATTFFVTAGTFGAMTIVGYCVKKDLSAMGRFLIMALIGLIIATVVNMFLASETFMWAITYIGVLIFVGLTAYDTQQIKQMMLQYGTEVNESTMKLALMGSLTLYLDFINLFLYLSRIFGNRNN